MSACHTFIGVTGAPETIGKPLWADSEDAITADLKERFQSALVMPPSVDPHLRGSITHLLSHPGSMVRPRLVFQVATAFGVERSCAVDLAVALEYFHTASLVFDDLPCMDNAWSRRGAACVHVGFGDAGAILAALALINRAYALTWRAMTGAPAHVQEVAALYVEQRLGVMGLLNGQSLDLNYATLPHDLSTTGRVAWGKTVSLIRLTLVLPALLGGASPREIQLLERMAAGWGLGYQAVDDLKDILQTPGESGKTTARDLHLDRPNIVLAIGIEPAVKRLVRLVGMGDRTLRSLLKTRPELAFLDRLRSDLESELARITRRAHGGATQ